MLVGFFVWLIPCCSFTEHERQFTALASLGRWRSVACQCSSGVARFAPQPVHVTQSGQVADQVWSDRLEQRTGPQECRDCRALGE